VQPRNKAEMHPVTVVRGKNLSIVMAIYLHKK
jgi:hypothetical protein